MHPVISKPFLKWAGGKSRLVSTLTPLLGEGQRLVEPFVGSGAVFMGTNYPRYLLCDSNPDLISLYTTLQQRPEELLQAARQLFVAKNNDASAYYSFRHEFNELTTENIRRSALFVYLNKHAFNGLCRYNSRGAFNVPFGKYDSPKLPERELTLFAQKSQLAEFKCLDFAQTYDLIQAGDVVYCDPPYVPLSVTANFTSYTKGAFTIAHQGELAAYALKAAKRGIKTVISNHDTELTRQLYQTAQVVGIDVRRSISSKSETRGSTKELLAVF